MNLFLLTDLEGISRVTDIEFMDRSSEKYQQARAFLSQDINLAVKTAFESGADAVYYLDGHGHGGNVIEEWIDPRAQKCSVAGWQQLLREGRIDCQIDLGSHARAGTVGGFLDHTFSSTKWFCHKINGIEMSELSFHALLCGAYGVPMVACIGDEAACRQAKEYIPDIYVGAVKIAEKRNHATPYENADAVLVRTVREALKNYQRVSLYRVDEPMTAELTFYRTDFCEEALARCGNDVRRIDARTLQRIIPKFVRYDDLKFIGEIKHDQN